VDAELLSRIQFALTASFHFIFPPISMGLGVMLVAMGIVYVRTRDPKWRQLSFFWVKIYGIVFALGVATGIVQEFEFGMNWADYSRFVGNVFGSLLAAEGVFAFFLEGGFLGLMLFGGNRLGPKLWLFSIFMVVFGAHFSAVWILMANSWMQTPAGYTIAQTPAPARAVMTDFWSVIDTPSFIPRLMHVFAASGTAGAALMASVSAWYVLRKKHVELAKDNLKLALPFFALYAFTNLFLFGPNMAIEVTNNQPLKLASMEGLWQSTSCAPMFLLGWVDTATQTTTGFNIPCLLSFLAYQDIHATVAGIDSFAPAAPPPVNLLFQVYHVMINMAPLLALIAFLAGVWFLWKRRLFQSRFVLWLLVVSVVLAEVAITAGWWTAEVGRQPWVVYNVLLTKDGVSPTLSGEDVAISLGSFIGLYGLLFLLFIFLLNRKIQAGPEPLEAVETVAVSSLPDTFREVFRKRPHSAGPPPPDDDAVLVPAAAADDDTADGGPGGRPDGDPAGARPGSPADAPAPAPREDES
jgi:cytochrome d ubiquinol oxidase subunit I